MGLFGGNPNLFRLVFYRGGDMRHMPKFGLLSQMGSQGKLEIEKSALVFVSKKIEIRMPFNKIDFSKAEATIGSRGTPQQAMAYAGAGMAWGSIGAMKKDLFVKIPFTDEKNKRQTPEFEFTNRGEAERFQKWLYEKIPSEK